MDLFSIVGTIPAIVLGGLITVALQGSMALIRQNIARLFGNTNQYVASVMKDPAITRVIMASMVQAQKEFGSTEGKMKFRYVKTRLIQNFPSLWAGAIDLIIQAVYDEFIKADFTK
jgi:hypothetical protein